MISTHEELVLQAHQQFDALLALVEEAKSQRIDCFEGDVFAGLLCMGLTLVRLFVVNKGTGDAGPSLDTAAGVWKRLENLHPRRYVSIFGEMTIDRTVYGTREKQKLQAAPLDAQLGLPDGDFSYLLQSWLQERCLDSDYAGSIQGAGGDSSPEPVGPQCRTHDPAHGGRRAELSGPTAVAARSGTGRTPGCYRRSQGRAHGAARSTDGRA